MNVALILMACGLNLLLGLILMAHHDDGRVIRWCDRCGGILTAPLTMFVAFFWPIGLWYLRRR